VTATVTATVTVTVTTNNYNDSASFSESDNNSNSNNYNDIYNIYNDSNSISNSYSGRRSQSYSDRDTSSKNNSNSIMCPLIKIIVLYSSSSFQNKISTCQDNHLKLTFYLNPSKMIIYLFYFLFFSTILFPYLQQMYGGLSAAGAGAGAGARVGPLCMW
jgi:hypothetical protein